MHFRPTGGNRDRRDEVQVIPMGQGWTGRGRVYSLRAIQCYVKTWLRLMHALLHHPLNRIHNVEVKGKLYAFCHRASA